MKVGVSDQVTCGFVYTKNGSVQPSLQRYINAHMQNSAQLKWCRKGQSEALHSEMPHIVLHCLDNMSHQHFVLIVPGLCCTYVCKLCKT